MSTTEAIDLLAERTTWRGRLHRWAAITFAPLFVLLVLLADQRGDRLALVVYTVGVIGMLSVSATYHSGRLPPRAFAVFKALDHAIILLAIGGSYTAVATLALHGSPARDLLTVIWLAIPAAVVIRLTWLNAPYPLVAVVYVAVGWMAVLELSELADAMSAVELTLLVVGGVLYTIGGVIYALHRPNPWPGVFGYHEVFHALVIGGVASHYATVALLL